MELNGVNLPAQVAFEAAAKFLGTTSAAIRSSINNLAEGFVNINSKIDRSRSIPVKELSNFFYPMISINLISAVADPFSKVLYSDVLKVEFYDALPYVEAGLKAVVLHQPKKSDYGVTITVLKLPKERPKVRAMGSYSISMINTKYASMELEGKFKVFAKKKKLSAVFSSHSNKAVAFVKTPGSPMPRKRAF